MLDSGSSVSLIQGEVLQSAQDVVLVTVARPIQLVTASGDQLPILQHVKAAVKLGELNVVHEFVVVKTLVAPVILGIDFLQRNKLMLDFTQNPVAVSTQLSKEISPIEDGISVAHVIPIYEATHKSLQACPISINQEN